MQLMSLWIVPNNVKKLQSSCDYAANLGAQRHTEQKPEAAGKKRYSASVSVSNGAKKSEKYDDV